MSKGRDDWIVAQCRGVFTKLFRENGDGKAQRNFRHCAAT
jgi:hypothetical protein